MRAEYDFSGGVLGKYVDKLAHKEIVEGMRALRRCVKPGKMSVREMVNEGRRF
jgi:hypothetical protein